MTQMVKNPPAMQETWVLSLGQEDSPGGGHSNVLQYLENLHGQRSLEGYSPWNSPGQNTGMGSHSLPQGIFPTQG